MYNDEMKMAEERAAMAATPKNNTERGNSPVKSALLDALILAHKTAENAMYLENKLGDVIVKLPRIPESDGEEEPQNLCELEQAVREIQGVIRHINCRITDITEGLRV